MDEETEHELKAAAADLARARARRDAAIRAARAKGAPFRSIAALVGLTHAGVKKIIDRD